MYAVSSCVGTVFMSRHGRAGSARGAEESVFGAAFRTRASDTATLPDRHFFGQKRRFRLDHKLRIAERAHFRNVEAFELDLRRDAVTPDRFQDGVDDGAECEHEAN